MFTPPPSPGYQSQAGSPMVSNSRGQRHLSPPPITLQPSPKRKLAVSTNNPNSTVDDNKKQTGKKYRYAVLFVPALLIIFTMCSTYVLHTPPGRQHTLAWTTWLAGDSFLPSLHRRDDYPQTPPSMASSPTLAVRADPTSATSASRSTASSGSPVSAQTTPTVPSSPPVLPTPFPQAFDSSQSIPLNFSSASCSAFFTNMTSSPSFRTCRPFSLLLQSSSDFLDVRSLLWYLSMKLIIQLLSRPRATSPL